MENAYRILEERGFVQQVSDEAAVSRLFDQERVTAYIGFNPSAASLHVGNLVTVMGLVHLQHAGHRPVVVVGGGTGLVGDPSGKTEMRKFLEADALQENLRRFRESFARFLTLDGEQGLLLDNAEWLLDLNYVEFLRDVGRHFSVNQMLAAEAYKQRLEKGLSFLEFNYQVLQAYDFVELHRRLGCRVQMGGNDQWGNICAGIELCRRLEGCEVFAITFPLLETADGKKMGKTEAGAVWLAADLLSPFEFYQYWVNCHDLDVERFFKIFTLLPLEEIRELCSVEGAELRPVKQRLAHEVTTLVHGREEAERAQAGARSLFGGQGGALSEVPSTELAAAEIGAGITAVELLSRAGLSSSRSEARRLIQSGGAYVNDERIGEVDARITTADFAGGELLVRSGKKRYHRFVLKPS